MIEMKPAELEQANTHTLVATRELLNTWFQAVDLVKQVEKIGVKKENRYRSATSVTC